MGLPKGLCCLETDCKCCPSPPQKKGRQSEIELAKLGISCFFTNKGSIIRNLIYRSIKLKGRLNEMGYSPIEVYPHATKVVLFEDKAPPKSSPSSITFLKEKLPPLIRGGSTATWTPWTATPATPCSTPIPGCCTTGSPPTRWVHWKRASWWLPQLPR